MSVAVSNFSSILKQMRDSYTGESPKEFSLAEHIGLQASSLSDAPADLQKVTKEHEQNLTNFHIQQETGLLNNVQSLEKDKNHSSFMDKMNKNRENAKKQATEMIDKYYNKLEDIGVKHPEQQELILVLADKVGAFMKAIMTKIMDVFVSVIATVSKAIRQAIDFIASSFKTFANTAKNFFAGLF